MLGRADEKRVAVKIVQGSAKEGSIVEGLCKPNTIERGSARVGSIEGRQYKSG